MLLDWTPEQKALRHQYQTIGAGIFERRRTEAEGFDHIGWQQLCDAGLWQMVIPPSHCGTCVDWWNFTAALEGLSSSIRSPALLLSIITQAGMVRALTLYGSTAQKDRYFSAILRGKLSATAIAEHSTGADLRNIETTLTQDWEGYLLQGNKYNIAHAPLADFMLVVCRLANTEKNSTALVLLDRDHLGVSSSAQDNKLGVRDLPTGSLCFDNVRLEERQLLGKPGDGLHELIDIISLGRLYYALIAANVIEPYLSDAIHYGRNRRSFNSPVDSYQYVISIKIGIERTRWLAYAALSQLLNGHADALMTCSIANLVGAEDLISSALGLVKLYGSVGYQDGGIATFARDALGFSSIGGTEEIHRKNIFSQLTRLAA